MKIVLCSTHGLQCPMPMVHSVSWACGVAAQPLLALPAGALHGGVTQPAAVDAAGAGCKRKRPNDVEACDTPVVLGSTAAWQEMLVQQQRPPVQCWLRASRSQLQQPLLFRTRLSLTDAADANLRQHDLLLRVDLRQAAHCPVRHSCALETAWDQALLTSSTLTVTSQVRHYRRCLRNRAATAVEVALAYFCKVI